MSYSRRQLYAMGETFGECATRREAGGKIIYGGGSGGGGSSTPKNTTQTVTQELPAWAQPYAKESLAKASALADSPYQVYEGERVAQFTPLQKQAFDQAGQQQVAGQIGFGSGLAGLAGTSSFSNPNAAASFMSPYMQQVVAQQMSSAQRQADIASTQRGAQAVKAGAFGGSRQAIENAEANRALASQKGEIQARGLQSAFEQAQNQFNQEQGQRINAAQTLGQLGQQQFGQELGITGQKAEFGQQQRAATQDILSQQYQDFLNQQRAPYDQLAFMTSMIRGTPMGGTTAQYQSQAAPSTASQLVGLGTAAAGMYGAAQGRAAGGEVKSYAAGGITGLLDDVDSLSDEQLAQMQQGEQRPLTAAAVAEEVMRRQELREGGAQQQAMLSQPPQTTVAEEELEMAGLPGLPARNLENMGDATMMAGGGIVAFQNRGAVPEPEDLLERQRAEDRKKIESAYEAGLIGAEEFGRALLDVGTLPLRGIAGALDTAVVRPIRAAGADIGYLSPMFVPEGSDPSSMTPFYDKMRMREEAPADIDAAIMSDETRKRANAKVSATAPAVVPATKETVDRGAPGAAPAGGLGALLNPRGFYDKNRQDIEALGAEEKALAEQEAEALLKDQEAMGERGAERKKRIEEDMAGLKGKKDQNFNMALIEAGLAMMAGDSANAFENIGKGALVGTKAFTEGTERLNREKARLDDALAQLEDLQFSDEKANKAELRKARGAVKQAEIGTKKALANLGIKETETVVDLYKTNLEIGSRERIAATAATRREGGAPDYMDAYLKQYLPKFAGTDALGNTMQAPSYEEYLRTIGLYRRPTEGATVLPPVK